MRMTYEAVVSGVFLSRQNRFVAKVLIDGKEETVHVKNTGRCRELLLPGARVFLEYHGDAEKKGRKTRYSLIGVYKERQEGLEPLRVNMDSQAPNQAAEEWVRDGGLGLWLEKKDGKPPVITEVRREVFYGNSRFDLAFLIDGKPAFMEVKGVTLECGGVASFPDAPTERGIKHLKELARAAADGYRTFVLFVIQMKGTHLFTPDWETHSQFGEALCQAQEAGVEILAFDCMVEETGFSIDANIPIRLSCVTM